MSRDAGGFGCLMPGITFDAGGLIALDRNDRSGQHVVTSDPGDLRVLTRPFG